MLTPSQVNTQAPAKTFTQSGLPACLNASSSLLVDLTQSKRHLELLGYKDGDLVYFRLLPGKGFNSPPQKIDFKLGGSWPKELTESDGHRGVYFVVNGGGHSDADVQTAPAIFIECDDLPLVRQENLWQEKGFPCPSYQVKTYRSIHQYWVFETPIPIELWRRLQAQLIEVLGADPANRNPSRVMRLAGSVYVKSELDPFQCELINVTDRRYSVSEIQDALDALAPAAPPPPKPTPKPPALRTGELTPPIPLERCISKESRVLIESGADSNRNDHGAKLARDLIGAANFLAVEGIPYSGDPRSLFFEYCHRCYPLDWSEREYETIWRKAEKENPPRGALDSEAIQNCLKKWERENKRRFASVTNSRQSPETAKDRPEPDLKSLCSELLGSGLSGADYEAKIIEIGKKTDTHPSEVRRQLDLIEESLGRIEARPETLAEVILLNDAEKHSVTLGELIPDYLATPINNLADSLNIKPETYLLPLLCGLSGTFKRGTRLIVDQRLGFEVPPQLYGTIVAPSSQKKSPALNAVGLKPLSLLQSKASDSYQTALAQYRQDYARYKSLTGDDLETEFPDGPPKEPTMEVYFSDSLTVEGLLSDISKQERGISIFCDELSGLFAGFNQYKKSGNDAQRFLELYDGKSTLIQRKKDGPTFIENPIVSIAGGIQPSVLAELFKHGDGSGQWARFMFVRQPAAPARLELDGLTYDLSGLINSLYQSFADLPAITFTLTREARALYFDHYNRYELDRVAKPDHPLSNVWGKACGWIGKLSITLHCIAYSAGEIPDFIGADTIAKAVKLTDFFISQSRVLYAELMQGAREELPTNLLKVLAMAERNGGSCSAREVVTAKIAKKTPDATALFEELRAHGLGAITKTGQSIRFTLS